MFIKKYFYLIHVQYLGYRYHGWQKQPNVKTVHHMIDRTLKFILEDRYFKTLGSGRTDAMVSAENAAFELFLRHPIEDIEAFLFQFNQNLPQDIRALSIQAVDEEFNIIQDSSCKEYHYVFAHADKFHPFCSPILTTVLDELNIEIMMEGAKLFEGSHNFKAYCYRATNDGEYSRTIDECQIVENDIYTANFFPKMSYVLKVKGKGFGRNQIRLIMGTLIELGKGQRDLKSIVESLGTKCDKPMCYIAPASGLILHKVEFDKH